MTVLNVADMHCGNCVARISSALEEANIKFTVSLEDKTVSVETEKVDIAISELSDLGFDAVKN